MLKAGAPTAALVMLQLLAQRYTQHGLAILTMRGQAHSGGNFRAPLLIQEVRDIAHRDCSALRIVEQ